MGATSIHDATADYRRAITDLRQIERAYTPSSPEWVLARAWVEQAHTRLRTRQLFGTPAALRSPRARLR